jgi:hypothetical protein
MHYLNFKYASFFLTIGIFVSELRAQDSIMERPIISFNIALGFDEGLQDLAATFDGDVRMHFQNQLFITQVHFTREMWPFNIETPHPPKEEFFSYQVLYGRTFPFHLKHGLFPFFPFSLLTKEEADYLFSVSIGVGRYEYVLRGPETNHSPPNQEPFITNARREDSVWGIPIQIEIVKVLSGSFGYVHRFYYNYNDIRKTYGILWGIQYNL